MGPYAQAADIYWAAGWRGILPLPVNAKHSPPKGFTGDQGVWPSYADVHAWKDGPESAGNIALRLPHHVLGIDVDHYADKHGGDTLTDAETEYGPLPATWWTTSRTDGISGIRLFRVPESLQWPGELGPDTELVQHHHRYAVVWPSMHPDGRQYAWIDPAGKRTTTPPHVDALPALPEPWIIGLTAGAVHADQPRNALPPLRAVQWLADAPNANNPCPRVAAALTRCCDDLSAGSRHAAARDATMRIVRLAAEGHHGAYSAMHTFGQAFFAACVDKTRGGVRHPGEAEHEFASLLTGAVNLVTADTPHIPPDDPCINPFSGLVPASAMTTIAQTTATATAQPQAVDLLLLQEIAKQRLRRDAKRILDEEERLRHFHEPAWRPTLVAELALPEEPVHYTVNDVMPTGANVVLTAQYKAGKTTMVNHLTRCLVDKEPFLGHYDVNFTGRVALFNYEVDERQYRRWLRDTNITNTDQVTVLNLRGYRMPLTQKAIEDWVVGWLTDLDIAVWIIDPYARAFLGSGDDENDNTQVGDFLDTLDVIKERAGVNDLVMPAHTGRAEQERGAERARGATRLDDWADVRWILTTDDNQNRYFRAIGRDVDQPEGRITYLGDKRGLVLDRGRGRAQMRDDNIAAIILDLVERNPGLSYRALRDGVRERLGHVDTKAVDNVRGQLLNRNRIRYVSPQREGTAGRHYPADVSDLIAGD